MLEAHGLAHRPSGGSFTLRSANMIESGERKRVMKVISQLTHREAVRYES